MSYATGAVRAKAIAEGEPSRYRYTDVPTWSGGKVLVATNSRYLGTLGNLGFFWTDRDSVLIARWEDIAPIELQRQRPKPDEGPAEADSASRN